MSQGPAKLSPLKFDHAAIPIRDPAASYDFYANTLGLPLLNMHSGSDWGGHPWLMLTFGLSDSRQLVLIAFRDFEPRRQRGLPKDGLHYAFSVSTKRALAQWKAKLEDAGVDHWEEDHGDQQSLYFEDPNGLILEITSPPSWPDQVFERDARAAIRRWMKAGATV